MVAFNPFVKQQEKTTKATETTIVEDVPVVKEGKKPRKPKSPQLSEDQIKSIIEMVQSKNKSYSEIADELNISKHQVNRVLVSTKKKLKQIAEQNPKMAEKINAIIESLSRPAETRPGRGGKKKVVNAAIDDIINNLLNQL